MAFSPFSQICLRLDFCSFAAEIHKVPGASQPLAGNRILQVPNGVEQHMGFALLSGRQVVDIFLENGDRGALEVAVSQQVLVRLKGLLFALNAVLRQRLGIRRLELRLIRLQNRAAQLALLDVRGHVMRRLLPPLLIKAGKRLLPSLLGHLGLDRWRGFWRVVG